LTFSIKYLSNFTKATPLAKRLTVSFFKWYGAMKDSTTKPKADHVSYAWPTSFTCQTKFHSWLRMSLTLAVSGPSSLLIVLKSHLW
jgi:hypothetical protein